VRDSIQVDDSATRPNHLPAKNPFLKPCVHDTRNSKKSHLNNLINWRFVNFSFVRDFGAISSIVDTRLYGLSRALSEKVHDLWSYPREFPSWRDSSSEVRAVSQLEFVGPNDCAYQPSLESYPSPIRSLALSIALYRNLSGFRFMIDNTYRTIILHRDLFKSAKFIVFFKPIYFVEDVENFEFTATMYNLCHTATIFLCTKIIT